MTDARLMHILKEKELCEFCPDCGNDEACIKCRQVTPITLDDLHEFYLLLEALLSLRKKLRQLRSKYAEISNFQQSEYTANDAESLEFVRSFKAGDWHEIHLPAVCGKEH